MFCTKCGNNNPDGVRFCTSCGAEMAERVAVKPPESAPTPVPSGDKNKKIITTAIIVVIVAAIAVGAYFLITGLVGKKETNNGTIDGVIELYEEGMKKCNAEKLIEATMPKSVIDESIEEEYDGNKKEYKEHLKEANEQMKEMYQSTDMEIVSVKKDGKEKKYDDDEAERLIEEIEEMYDVEVKDVRKCKVEVTYKMDGEKEDSSQYMTFYKVKGQWYIYDPNVL